MTKKIQLHVGSVVAMGSRFVDAWRRAQAVEKMDEVHVTFLSYQAMTDVCPGTKSLRIFGRQHAGARLPA